MRYPTNNNRITSQYGYRMRNSGLDFHGGTDYGGEVPSGAGDPLHPIADNTKIVFVGYDEWRGHNIILEHNSHCTRYNHFLEIYVKEGDIVHENNIVGLMGSSGDSTGAHLHFEVHECKYINFHEKWPNGEYKHTVDPELFFLRYLENAELRSKLNNIHAESAL